MAGSGGFASLTRPAPLAPGQSGGFAGSGTSGSGLVSGAAGQARNAMNILGIPNLGDFLKGAGGGFGTTEFGNAGVAGAGATYARGQLEDWKGGLEGLQKQIGAREKVGLGPSTFMPQLAADRAEYARPTESGAYQAEMGLARERTAAAASQDAQQAAEAAQRRGYGGGYDPRQSDLDRMQALSTAGFGALKDVRDQALQKYGTDVGGYGAERAQQEDRYKTDIGALTSEYGAGMEGYKAGLGAFSDLTKTQAELPTKMLSALSPYYSSILGGAGGIFGDVLQADIGQQARGDAIARSKPGGTLGGAYGVQRL